MFKRTLILMLSIFFILAVMGCVKRIPLNYEQTRPNSLVQIKTVTGKTCEGLVRNKKPSFVVIQVDKNDRNKIAKINRDDIASIIGQKEYVYDAAGNVISDWEIDRVKKNKHLLLYAIGGGGISLGASFFIGSLINRGIDDVDQGNNAMWATTAVGTTIGTILFSRAGSQKDRLAAIDQIREYRYELAKKQAEKERLKRKKIQEEIQRLKAERQKQNEEMKKLMEKAKKKNKK